MAVVVNSATQVSTVSGNGGGRINTFDVSVSFGAGDDAVTEAAILTPRLRRPLSSPGSPTR